MSWLLSLSGDDSAVTWVDRTARIPSRPVADENLVRLSSERVVTSELCGLGS